MTRKKARCSALMPILESFIQGQDDTLSLYLAWVCSTHDSIVDELSRRSPQKESENSTFSVDKQSSQISYSL
jgi:hypothetical protein